MTCLTLSMPPIYDQGFLSSCSGNAIAAAYEYDLKKQGLPSFLPSRLFIYYNERDMEHTITTDSGALVKDGLATIKQFGVCPEDIWPYDASRVLVKPSEIAYRAALRHKAIQTSSVTLSASNIVKTLSKGFPIICGIMLYSEFENDEVAKTGMVPMPSPISKQIGGHAVVIIGFDDMKKQLIMRNSWGYQWGDGGNFYLPFDYIRSDLIFDAWTIEVVT